MRFLSYKLSQKKNFIQNVLKRSYYSQALKLDKEIRSYNEIPQVPHRIPFISSMVNFFIAGGSTQLHRYCDQQFKKYGPIYREQLGTVDGVFLCNSKMMREVFSQEDATPTHFLPEPWLLYNNDHDIQRGLFFRNGDSWKTLRQSMNGMFFKKNALMPFMSLFDEITEDFIYQWKDTLNKSGEVVLVNPVNFFHAYSIEIMGAFVFGRRLGCINIHGQTLCDEQKYTKKLTKNLQKSVNDIFLQTCKMQFFPAKLARDLQLPVWKKFSTATQNALEIANELVSLNINYSAHNNKDGILHGLLQCPHLKKKDLAGVIVDLLLASTDTISQTLQWSLYLLGKNSLYQEAMATEANNVFDGSIINEESLKKLALSRAIMKETLRLYPVSPFISRLYSHDIQVGGFEIPANKMIIMALYTAGRMEEHYENASHFQPERWRRNNIIKNIKNDAFLPFALGKRACIGRKVAEAEIMMLISKIVKNFNIEIINKKDVDIRLVLITSPDKPISFKLTSRKYI